MLAATSAAEVALVVLLWAGSFVVLIGAALWFSGAFRRPDQAPPGRWPTLADVLRRQRGRLAARTSRRRSRSSGVL